ncbi:serine palmitoyltransferase small subunit B isoform X1 [Nannospalax galili]|nr:serine palmitoyltransferase small subunit B isoform X1 [Nannospalax galili]
MGSWDLKARGEGSGAACILFGKESLRALRLDTSLRNSVFFLSIINHRNEFGRIGVLAIVQRAGPEHLTPRASSAPGALGSSPPLRRSQLIRAHLKPGGKTFYNLKKLTMDFKRVKEYFAWLYYQYQIITCCAVMEPWEQSMFNTILLTIVAMVVYTAYVFIPIHIRLAWEFFSKICGYHSSIAN